MSNDLKNFNIKINDIIKLELPGVDQNELYIITGEGEIINSYRITSLKSGIKYWCYKYDVIKVNSNLKAFV